MIFLFVASFSFLKGFLFKKIVALWEAVKFMLFQFSMSLKSIWKIITFLTPGKIPNGILIKCASLCHFLNFILFFCILKKEINKRIFLLLHILYNDSSLTTEISV